jgi:four helix bundle protein
MKSQFDHEKLKVYQDTILFNGWVGEFLGTIAAKAAAKDQLDRAATSIALNIAEGNGKFSGRDRARFFEIARGSAVECAACLDVLVARKLTDTHAVDGAKNQLVGIVKMLMGLLRRFSERDDRVFEDAPGYGLQTEQEQEQEQD